MLRKVSGVTSFLLFKELENAEMGSISPGENVPSRAVSTKSSTTSQNSSDKDIGSPFASKTLMSDTDFKNFEDWFCLAPLEQKLEQIESFARKHYIKCSQLETIMKHTKFSGKIIDWLC